MRVDYLLQLAEQTIARFAQHISFRTIAGQNQGRIRETFVSLKADSQKEQRSEQEQRLKGPLDQP